MVSAISSGRAPARAIDDGDMVVLLRDSSPVPRPPRMLAQREHGAAIAERRGFCRGATTAGGLEGPPGAPGTAARSRGAPRLCRGATSAGGLGGPLGAPHHINSVR